MQGIGEKEGGYMNNKITYSDEPIEAKVIDDFLPSPDQLVMKEENVKVTLTLSKKSVDFFKSQAEENHVGYQTMIRSLVDQYASRFDEANPS